MSIVPERLFLSIYPVVQQCGKSVSIAVSAPAGWEYLPFHVDISHYDPTWKEWTTPTTWQSGHFSSVPVIFEFVPTIVTQWRFTAWARSLFMELVKSPDKTFTSVPATIYYKCPYCDQTFLTQEELNTHILDWHSGSPVFQCPIDHLNFTTQAELDEHMKTHIPDDGNGGGTDPAVLGLFIGSLLIAAVPLVYHLFKRKKR